MDERNLEAQASPGGTRGVPLLPTKNSTGPCPALAHLI